MLRLIGSFILFLFSISTFAGPVEKPFFYEVEKNGQRAFLLGTIHTGVEFKDLPSYVTAKIVESETVVLETNLTEAQQLIQTQFPLPAPNSLKEQLSSSQWTRLVSTVAKFGVTPEVADTLYPLHAGSLFAVANFPQTLQPMDHTLSQVGGRAFDYLEPASLQIDIVHAQFTIDELRKALDMSEAVQIAKVEQLLSLYYSGDEEALFQFLVKSITPEFQEVLLTRRNHSWIPQIDRIMAVQGEEFFAVGAGHLGGENGILNLLRASGFTITRIQQ